MHAQTDFERPARMIFGLPVTDTAEQHQTRQRVHIRIAARAAHTPRDPVMHLRSRKTALQAPAVIARDDQLPLHEQSTIRTGRSAPLLRRHPRLHDARP